MPKFVTAVDNDPKLVVELEQDGDDVNILVNEVIVAYFDADDGTLHRMAWSGVGRVNGLAWGDDNRIVVTP